MQKAQLSALPIQRALRLPKSSKRCHISWGRRCSCRRATPRSSSRANPLTNAFAPAKRLRWSLAPLRSIRFRSWRGIRPDLRLRLYAAREHTSAPWPMISVSIWSGAHLAALIRTRSGPFVLSESITLEQLAASVEQGTVSTLLTPPDSVLQHYPALQLDAATAEHVLHGNAFRSAQITQPPAELARVYDASGHFLAIAAWNAAEEIWQPKKVFSQHPD